MLLVDERFVVLGGAGELRIGTFSDRRFRDEMRAKIASGQTWNVPAYWKGRLYVRNHEGALVCIRIGRE